MNGIDKYYYLYMDLFSCIALIVFGLLVLIGRFLLIKFDQLSPFEIKHPAKYGLGPMCINIFLILLGTCTGVAGVVSLLTLLL